MLSVLAPALGVVLTAMGPSVEQVQTAERAAAQAVRLHADGDLVEASRVLAEAYALYPDRDFLFMRGVIERERGECETAVPLFEAFVAEHPSLVDVEAAQKEIELCDTEPPPPPQAAPPDPTPVPPPADPIPAATPPPALIDRPELRANAWPRDKLGGGLLGAGLVVATTGAVLLVAAGGKGNAATQAPTAGEYRDGRSDARTLSAAGWAVLGVGASALIGSVIRYAIVARRSKARQR